MRTSAQQPARLSLKCMQPKLAAIASNSCHSLVPIQALDDIFCHVVPVRVFNIYYMTDKAAI